MVSSVAALRPPTTPGTDRDSLCLLLVLHTSPILQVHRGIEVDTTTPGGITMETTVTAIGETAVVATLGGVAVMAIGETAAAATTGRIP